MNGQIINISSSSTTIIPPSESSYITRLTSSNNYVSILYNTGQIDVIIADKSKKHELNEYHLSLSKVLLNFRNMEIDQIVFGYNYFIVLTNDGNLFSYGYNNYGQLGLVNINNIISNNDEEIVPQLITKLNNKKIINIKTGKYHVLALTDHLELYVWGINNYGQLGCNDMFISIPKYISPFIKLSNNITNLIIVNGKKLKDRKNMADNNEDSIYDISCTDHGSIILSSYGYVYTFGEGLILGLNNKIRGSNTPILLKECIKNGEIAQLPTIKHISTGASHCFALSTDNELFGWGMNVFKCIINGEKVAERISLPTLLSPGFSVKSISSWGYNSILSDFNNNYYGLGPYFNNENGLQKLSISGEDVKYFAMSGTSLNAFIPLKLTKVEPLLIPYDEGSDLFVSGTGMVGKSINLILKIKLPMLFSCLLGSIETLEDGLLYWIYEVEATLENGKYAFYLPSMVEAFTSETVELFTYPLAIQIGVSEIGEFSTLLHVYENSFETTQIACTPSMINTNTVSELNIQVLSKKQVFKNISNYLDVKVKFATESAEFILQASARGFESGDNNYDLSGNLSLIIPVDLFSEQDKYSIFIAPNGINYFEIDNKLSVVKAKIIDQNKCHCFKIGDLIKVKFTGIIENIAETGLKVILQDENLDEQILEATLNEQVGNSAFVQFQLPEYSGTSNSDSITCIISYSFNGGLTYPIKDKFIYFLNEPIFNDAYTEVASLIGNTEIKFGCNHLFAQQKIKILYDFNGDEIELESKLMENNSSNDWNKDVVFKIPSPLTSDLISSLSDSSKTLYDEYFKVSAEKDSKDIKEFESSFSTIIASLIEFQKVTKVSIFVDGKLFKTSSIKLYAPLFLEKLDLATGKVNTSAMGILFGKKIVSCQNIILRLNNSEKNHSLDVIGKTDGITDDKSGYCSISFQIPGIEFPGNYSISISYDHQNFEATKFAYEVK